MIQKEALVLVMESEKICHKIKYKSFPMIKESFRFPYGKINQDFMTSHSPSKTILHILH